MYIPTFNLTLEYKSGNEIKSAEKIAKKTKLRQVIKDPLELTKLSLNIDEISDNLENKENNILRNKYFVYPVGSGTLVIIIASIVGIVLWVKKIKIKRQTEQANTEIQRRQNDAMLY